MSVPYDDGSQVVETLVQQQVAACLEIHAWVLLAKDHISHPRACGALAGARLHRQVLQSGLYWGAPVAVGAFASVVPAGNCFVTRTISV